jgi:4-alpha-glucanotransferase
MRRRPPKSQIRSCSCSSRPGKVPSIPRFGILQWSGHRASLATVAQMTGFLVAWMACELHGLSPDSSDVSAHPELFLLEEERRPRFVAGVPRDYFSARGLLWGNPVCDWDRRVQRPQSWESGCQVRAPICYRRSRENCTLLFIVEDLGLITPDVYAFRDWFDLPRTRVPPFAFGGDSHNPYLPPNYIGNTVVYTGTHDNPTTRNRFEELPNDQRQILWSYLGREGGESREAAPALMGLAWSSVAALSMAPLQDLLNLGREACMNVPGPADGNWVWHCREDTLPDQTFEGLRDLAKNSRPLPHTGEISTVTQPEGNSSAGRGFVTPSAV